LSPFALLMAAFLSLAPYQFLKDKKDLPENLTSLEPAAIVDIYHQTCQGLVNLPSFKEDPDFDLDALVDLAAFFLEQKKEADKEATKESEQNSNSSNPQNPPASEGSTEGSTETAGEARPLDRGEVTFNKFSELFDLEKILEFYTDVCKEAKLESYEKYDLKPAVEFFESIRTNIPDISILKKPLPQSSVVLDRHGQVISEVFAYRNRRDWVDITDIPKRVQQAFVAMEDQRFFRHNGVDDNGLARAIVSTLSGSIQGGSSITQQLAKNLFFLEDVETENRTNRLEDTVRRKIKEFVVAFQIEKDFSKEKILGHYLNLIYLGRSSWGVQTASRAYFQKDLKDLNLTEIAFLAGLPKGPNNYEPELYRERALARRDLVLNAMAREPEPEKKLEEAGVKENADRKQEPIFMKPPYITEAEKEEAKKQEPRFKPPRVNNRAPYFTDYLRRLTRDDTGIRSFLDANYTIHSTLDLELQETMEAALQETLVQYDLDSREARWKGPLNNLARYLEVRDTNDKRVDWESVAKIRLAKYTDVHFKVALITGRDKRPGRYEGRRTIGFIDGSTGYLDDYTEVFTKKSLKWGDVIFVKKQTEELMYQIRDIPEVQGAAIALDVHTGDVLAMTGGFSFHTHPYNRATFGLTHPGSVLKPFSYLLALDEKLQPTTRIKNTLVTLPKKEGCNQWRVTNADNTYNSTLDMRHCFEQSYNACLANMMPSLKGGLEVAFQNIRDILKDFKIYSKPIGCYPLVLGAQETSVYRVARAFTAIANGGELVEPRFFTKIALNTPGEIKSEVKSKQIQSVDSVSLEQMKSFMQGVLLRGTAVGARDIGKYVGGKTGSAQNNRSAWFAGFSNDIAVAVYIGYDKGRNLAPSTSGAKVALPIAKKIFNKSFDILGRKEDLISENNRNPFASYEINNYTRPGRRQPVPIPEIFRPEVTRAPVILPDPKEPNRARSNGESIQTPWSPDYSRPIVPSNKQTPLPGSAIPNWDGNVGVPGQSGQYIDDIYFRRRPR